jgi:hypothetical protein
VPNVPPPSKTVLDAQSDQAMAVARDLRGGLLAQAGGGDRLLTYGIGLAVILREQFPGNRDLGRIVLAVARSLRALGRAAEAGGAPLGPREIMAVAALAAEQLDREEARDDG